MPNLPISQNPKTLPIGDPSFESIRSANNLYVDKTRHIFQMITGGKYYFLSRPRRFGKSLTISTLRCLFQGQKDLFSGLWIAQHSDWQWQVHPVVVIDFNGKLKFFCLNFSKTTFCLVFHDIRVFV
ncbi:MAG: AAA family ATPase [Desulfamplus sp.]|nr:AAA family ATPase [Desulfamplus sp.]